MKTFTAFRGLLEPDVHILISEERSAFETSFVKSKGAGIVRIILILLIPD